MVHDISLIPCSLRLPKSGSRVEFWDWLGEKYVGNYFKVMDIFIVMSTGRAYVPVYDIVYWKYVN